MLQTCRASVRSQPLDACGTESASLVSYYREGSRRKVDQTLPERGRLGTSEASNPGICLSAEHVAAAVVTHKSRVLNQREAQASFNCFGMLEWNREKDFSLKGAGSAPKQQSSLASTNYGSLDEDRKRNPACGRSLRIEPLRASQWAGRELD
jgi:hypothetical protein